MKNVFPKTKMEWIQSILFPFKFYIIFIPVMFIILMVGNRNEALAGNGPVSSQIHFLVIGYILCVVVLTVGGIFAAFSTRNWKMMLSPLIYAFVGFFMLSKFLLPMLVAFIK
jgi:hypothetical protein